MENSTNKTPVGLQWIKFLSVFFVIFYAYILYNLVLRFFVELDYQALSIASLWVTLPYLFFLASSMLLFFAVINPNRIVHKIVLGTLVLDGVWAVFSLVSQVAVYRNILEIFFVILIGTYVSAVRSYFFSKAVDRDSIEIQEADKRFKKGLSWLLILALIPPVVIFILIEMYAG